MATLELPTVDLTDTLFYRCGSCGTEHWDKLALVESVKADTGALPGSRFLVACDWCRDDIEVEVD